MSDTRLQKMLAVLLGIAVIFGGFGGITVSAENNIVAESLPQTSTQTVNTVGSDYESYQKNNQDAPHPDDRVFFGVDAIEGE